MRSRNWTIALLLVSFAGIGNAWADRGHVYFGAAIGPGWGPWWYPPVVVERPPPIYIEQSAAPLAAVRSCALTMPQSNYWYYCDAAKAYYPYVKECPGSRWQKVLSHPAGQP